MNTDITVMGPHALARMNSRTLALQSFGINTSLVKQDNPVRTLAKQSRISRELTMQGGNF